jgi:hypothetical protein
LAVGLIRTLSCGGWTFITSTDDHDLHDIAMAVYLLCTLPWQLGVLSTSARHLPTLLKWRRILVAAFFGTTPFMIYFFIQHKVHRVPGGKADVCVRVALNLISLHSLLDLCLF